MSRNLRAGLTTVVVAILIAVAPMAYFEWLAPQWLLIELPLDTTSGKTTSPNMSIPSNATYEINLYASEKAKYVDCLFGQEPYAGQDPHRCDHHRRVVDINWVLRDDAGAVLAKGVSGGTCCGYTTEDKYGPVVSTKIDAFTLPRKTTARLELAYHKDMAALVAFEPRVEVERTWEAVAPGN